MKKWFYKKYFFQTVECVFLLKGVAKSKMSSLSHEDFERLQVNDIIIFNWYFIEICLIISPIAFKYVCS